LKKKKKPAFTENNLIIVEMVKLLQIVGAQMPQLTLRVYGGKPFSY
jgi:hypothetical protein